VKWRLVVFPHFSFVPPQNYQKILVDDGVVFWAKLTITKIAFIEAEWIIFKRSGITRVEVWLYKFLLKLGHDDQIWNCYSIYFVDDWSRKRQWEIFLICHTYLCFNSISKWSIKHKFSSQNDQFNSIKRFMVYKDVTMSCFNYFTLFLIHTKNNLTILLQYTRDRFFPPIFFNDLKFII